MSAGGANRIGVLSLWAAAHSSHSQLTKDISCFFCEKSCIVNSVWGCELGHFFIIWEFFFCSVFLCIVRGGVVWPGAFQRGRQIWDSAERCARGGHTYISVSAALRDAKPTGRRKRLGGWATRKFTKGKNNKKKVSAVWDVETLSNE